MYNNDEYLYQLKDHREYEDGWYFSDEVEMLHGPFETKEDALWAFNHYCLLLESDLPAKEESR